MKCFYCKKPVYGGSGMTIPSKGSAHISCHNVHESIQRKFRGISISDLSDEDFQELKELILSEDNFRNRSDDSEDDFELF